MYTIYILFFNKTSFLKIKIKNYIIYENLSRVWNNHSLFRKSTSNKWRVTEHWTANIHAMSASWHLRMLIVLELIVCTDSVRKQCSVNAVFTYHEVELLINCFQICTYLYVFNCFHKIFLVNIFLNLTCILNYTYINNCN